MSCETQKTCTPSLRPRNKWKSSATTTKVSQVSVGPVVAVFLIPEAILEDLLAGKYESFLKLFPSMQHHILRTIDFSRLTSVQQANLFKVLHQVGDMRSLSLTSSQYLTDSVFKYVTFFVCFVFFCLFVLSALTGPRGLVPEFFFFVYRVCARGPPRQSHATVSTLA